ncbi:MFS transporter [Pseudomonadales bacterium]|nr:MFS transporter [Gammaproteobacteria bacterium]MBT7541280.1 MFS transporter [Gammaproteobacteria bacterium]MDC0894600.1 MFS transporter [Pseudomonadales bacterium]MDC1084227.1 MFS transporter [Pseudomonadales bacterium]MDC6450385.1 MFS transporter [Pseudomonadales bacterium]
MHTITSKPVNINDLIDHGKFSFRQILIVLLCLVFNMVDGFDITAMAVTAHQIGEDMQLSEDKLGLVFSFSLAGMMLGAMFLAALSDVIGRRTMIIITLTLVGVTVLLTASVNSLPALILLRFISGLGAGAMLASVATLASEYSPEKFRAMAVTAVTAGYPLGAMTTGLVASSVVPEFGWQGMFIAGGSATLLLALIAFFMIPESLYFLCKKQPDDALQRVNRILQIFKVQSLQHLPSIEDTGGATEADRQNIYQKMLTLLTPEFRRSTLTLWATFFLCISTLYFLMSWTPKLIINLGYSADAGNLAFTLFNFGGVLGIFILGYLASKWSLSTLISIFAITSAVFMWAFAGAVSLDFNQTNLMLLIFIIGISLQGGYTGMYAVAAKIYPIEIRSTGVGWAIGLGRFGAVLGPGIAGYMIASGLPITINFMVFAIPMLIGGIFAYQLRVR